jgi:UDP-N-acetylglucosamine 1-carboxyvinyltransferase
MTTALRDESASTTAEIGALIKATRQAKGMTQTQLADALGTKQSAIARIEAGGQSLSVEMLSRINTAMSADLLHVGANRPTHLRVTGGTRLSGTIGVNSSKNGAVALLCAALLNRGRTVLKSVAHILEVDRIVDVLRSIGVRATWSADGRDLELVPPERLDLDSIDADTAKRTRSIIMFLGPLLSRQDAFAIPYAGGCDLGTRTVEPHMIALRHFGLDVVATENAYRATVSPLYDQDLNIVLTERGDTVTENAIMAAARHPGVTTLRNASPNYMVQDLCFYLELLGVRIDGIGTTTLRIHGQRELNADVTYTVAEDPVEAMSLLTAGIVTGSEITVERVPIEFMEIELATLAQMGLRYDLSAEYLSGNARTRLVDLTVYPSELHAPIDKIHPMPFPGLNIDNLPFFVLIAACAEGSTLIHDWVYDNRAIYLTNLTRLGADVRLLDPHRLDVTGPTRFSGAEITCPPALRPAVVILLGMLAAKGTSVLRGVDIISRGYEQLADRLVSLGAQIETFRD